MVKHDAKFKVINTNATLTILHTFRVVTIINEQFVMSKKSFNLIVPTSKNCRLLYRYF